MFSHIKNALVEKATDIISEQIKEFTDGKVTIESIRQGQVKVDADGYVDKLLSHLNTKLESNQLNNINLPDETVEFEKDIACGIIVPGKIDIRDGKMKGLATFCRIGDAVLDINALRDPIASVKVTIGVKQTTVDYAGTIDFYCFQPDVAILGSLSEIAINVILEVDRDLSVDLHGFDVSSKGSLKLNFEDLGYFEFLSGDLSKNLENSIKGSTLDYLEKSVKNYCTQIVSLLPANSEI